MTAEGNDVSDGLREAVARAMNDATARRNEEREPSLPTARWDAQTPYVRQMFNELADAVLALPELAALRAKADAADRVEELLAAADRRAQHSPARMFSGEPFPVCIRADRIRRALDGPAPC